MPPDLAVCATWKGSERQTLGLLVAATDVSTKHLAPHIASPWVKYLWLDTALCRGQIYLWEVLLYTYSQRPSYGEKRFYVGQVICTENLFSKYNMTDIIKMPL